MQFLGVVGPALDRELQKPLRIKVILVPPHWRPYLANLESCLEISIILAATNGSATLLTDVAHCDQAVTRVQGGQVPTRKGGSMVLVIVTVVS